MKKLLAGLVICGLVGMVGCNSEDKVTGPEPVVAATPIPTPTPICKPSALRVWSALGAWPQDGYELMEFRDHEWAYLRAQVVDVRGKGLDPDCEWDQYISWSRLSGDADCRTFGGENNTRIGLYCFGIGDVSICSDASKDGVHLKGCARFFVRSQPVS